MWANSSRVCAEIARNECTFLFLPLNAPGHASTLSKPPLATYRDASRRKAMASSDAMETTMTTAQSQLL